ncbi:hypothetical protein WA026_000919, partial [Henosepilachna vigintioctopunctata]
MAIAILAICEVNINILTVYKIRPDRVYVGVVHTSTLVTRDSELAYGYHMVILWVTSLGRK